MVERRIAFFFKLQRNYSTLNIALNLILSKMEIYFSAHYFLCPKILKILKKIGPNLAQNENESETSRCPRDGYKVLAYKIVERDRK